MSRKYVISIFDDGNSDDSEIEVVEVRGPLSSTTTTSSSAVARRSTTKTTATTKASSFSSSNSPTISQKAILQLDLTEDDFVSLLTHLFQDTNSYEARKHLESPSAPSPLDLTALNTFPKTLKPLPFLLSSPSPPPFNEPIIKYLNKRVTMFLESRDFDPNPPPTSEEDEFMPSLPCSLCASSTPLQSLVFCTREHPYCIDCVKSYMTLTPSAMNANLSNITCVTPKCHGVFERKDVCKILGPYETLVRQERDEEVSNRVAVGKGVVVHCMCGFVGVGNGGEISVVCSQCNREYCGKCGKKDCIGKCGDDGEMEGTKKCPNCGLKISKAEGCNHVKCDQSFGGCGYDFCWLCLGNYPNCGCGGFERESERVARELAREEENRAASRMSSRYSLPFHRQYATGSGLQSPQLGYQNPVLGFGSGILQSFLGLGPGIRLGGSPPRRAMPPLSRFHHTLRATEPKTDIERDAELARKIYLEDIGEEFDFDEMRGTPKRSKPKAKPSKSKSKLSLKRKSKMEVLDLLTPPKEDESGILVWSEDNGENDWEEAQDSEWTPNKKIGAKKKRRKKSNK